MKIKRKTFWGGIIAALCACTALTFGAVFSSNNKVEASAATATMNATTVKPTMSFGTIKYAQSSTSSPLWGSNAGVGTYSYNDDLSATNPDTTRISSAATVGADGTSGTVTTDFDMTANRNKIIAVPVYLTFDLPANTVYRITWNWSFTDIAAGKQEHAIHYFQDTPIDNFLDGDYYGKWTNSQDFGAKHDMVVYNDTSTDKTDYTLYSIYYAYVMNATSGDFSFQFDLSFDFMEGPQIELPATSGDIEKTYTGSPLQFDLKYAGTPTVNAQYHTESTATYDKAYECVEVASVTGIDYEGNAITIANSTVELNGTNNGEGTFKPTKAGTYKVKLKIKDSFLSRGVKFTGGVTEKELTYTVKRKAVDAPSISDSTKPYKGAEYDFYPDEKFDADIMTVDQSASSSNVAGANIIWDDTNKKIKATNAATYTVKFKLTDKNYLWRVGAVESAADQSATITITPKKLKVPTISGDKVYTGAAQTFQLFDFDSGNDIKVTNAAGANGKTITGVGGVAWMDKTDKFEAKDVDDYTVTLQPRSTTNYVWDDATGGSGVRTCKFAITQKELSFTFTCSETGGAWEYGTSGVTITATENSIAADSLSLIFYYDNKTNLLTGTPDPLNGKITQIEIPDTITNGKHTLYAELHGSTGANGNYKLAENKNSFKFNVTSGAIDLSDIEWSYTVDGANGGKIENGGELPFKLKNGTTAGVLYELSVNIPDELNYIVVDTSKYTDGYNGDISKNTVTAADSVYTLTVALKSTDSTKEFSDGNGGMSSTCDLTITWKIIKGTFDLSGVKWEYTYTDSYGQKQTKDYTGALEYDDINYAVRIKASTLPAGLTLAEAYEYSDRQRNADSYSASAKKSDFSWNRANFNDPDDTVAALTLSWQIKQKNLHTNFKYERVQATKTDGTPVSFFNKVLDIDDKYKSFVKYEYTDSEGNVVSLQEIIDAVDMTSIKNYTVRAYIDPAATAASNFELTDNGTDPTDTITTGSNNAPVYAVIDGVLINGVNASDYKVVYDGQPHFNKLEVVSGSGIKISDFTVTYYKGASLSAEKFADGEYPVQAGEYLMEIVLGSSAQDDYIMLLDVIKITIEKKEIVVPTVGEIVFSGEYINLADYLGGSYAEYKDIITLSGDYQDLRNVSQSGYKARLVLIDSNYKWAQPATAEPASMKLFAVKSFDAALEVLDDVTAELPWNITPLVVDASEMWVKGKSGATLNLPASISKFIDAETLSVLYRYYDEAEQYVETPELKGGKSFMVEAVFGGIDAENGNVLFKTADGNVSAVSDKVSYTVPQSAAVAFLGSTLVFIKANWLWFAIGAAVLLFLIILICIIAGAKRRKRKREDLAEKRRLEKEAREDQRRREDREERMARLMQQQMLMPQMVPQGMAQAGGASSNEILELKAEMAAMRTEATLRAEMAAKESAEIKAVQAAEQQVANLLARLGGEQVVTNGVTLDKLTELVEKTVERVLDRREKAAAAPSTVSDGAAAPTAAQVPPDTVMTTVTTTKIDTTKKSAQNAQAAQAAPAGRTVVRNFVAPMPVDDGRVFDVGGFYKPADPMTDMDLTDDENKE